MTGKVIGRLLCGECNGQRSVMGELVDSERGAVLRARATRFPHLGREKGPTLLTIADMHDDLSGWTDEHPGVLSIECARHGWVAVSKAFLADMEAEYRTRGTAVRRILDHPPT